ncbi:MAG: hypothetical protein ACRD3V_21515 [Vicinamibacteria bacterium]
MITGILLLGAAAWVPTVPVAIERTPSLSAFALEIARKEVLAIYAHSDVHVDR